MTREEIKLNELGDIDKLIAEGNKCTYCGKKLDTPNPDEINYAKAIKRYFPVCSSECESEVTKYVESDRRHKKHFYTMFTVCAFTTLIGVLINFFMICRVFVI